MVCVIMSCWEIDVERLSAVRDKPCIVSSSSAVDLIMPVALYLKQSSPLDYIISSLILMHIMYYTTIRSYLRRHLMHTLLRLRQ